MHWVLFYKRLVSLGGAEVLLGQHYAWLKAKGHDVTVICFEHAGLERIAIEPEDIAVVPGHAAFSRICALTRLLRQQSDAIAVCHSGYIEFGIAALLTGLRYSVFVHQPTTMSFNESDKFSARFWTRYQRFARHDAMYDRLCAQRAGFSSLHRAYVEARSWLSQFVLHRARALFVLSQYAVREKFEIFGLRATCLAGAIATGRLPHLLAKSELRPEGESIELVSVSRIDENKRIEVLIAAVAELRARGKSVRLRLGGKGPATKDLMAFAEKMGVSECIEFLGFVPEEDVPALYAGMDLFVTIDWADYRITAYEVLAENRRVIVSDDTDADPELLASGYLFTSPADAVALADTILRALGTPVIWDRLRLKQYLMNFTWPAYFENIGRVVEETHAA